MKLTKEQAGQIKDIESNPAIARLYKNHSKGLIRDLIKFLVITEPGDCLRYQINTGRNNYIAGLQSLCEIGIAQEVDVNTTDYVDYYPDEDLPDVKLFALKP